MEFQKSAIELIKTRTSTRTFAEKAIDLTALQKMETYLARINEKSKIKARFTLTTTSATNGNHSQKLGTYGFIAGADVFIVGILDKGEKDALEFGYVFEKIILFATDLALQTCWLGGTFNQKDFLHNMDVRENEYIAIVSPLGIENEKPRLFERALRTVSGANKRRPWSELFFEGNSSTPLNEQKAGLYAVPLEMVRLGPSAANKQPWRIVKEKDKAEFHFFLCRTKGYDVRLYDLQKNDLGIAKCHFELAAIELGLKGGWTAIDNVNEGNNWEYMCTWSAEAGRGVA